MTLPSDVAVFYPTANKFDIRNRAESEGFVVVFCPDTRIIFRGCSYTFSINTAQPERGIVTLELKIPNPGIEIQPRSYLLFMNIPRLVIWDEHSQTLLLQIEMQPDILKEYDRPTQVSRLLTKLITFVFAHMTGSDDPKAFNVNISTTKFVVE